MNGNVYDIGQTINGVSRFLFFNYRWYYFVEGFSNEYEYDQQELTKLVTENEFNEVKLLGNIFESFKTCYFVADFKNSSATICKNCGKERWQHKLY
jgi:hypothetical protein